jgi:hypothetical protein
VYMFLCFFSPFFCLLQTPKKKKLQKVDKPEDKNDRISG